MANTIAEYELLSTDSLMAGIVDTIVKESPLLEMMPFITIVGNAYKYNWETALAGTTWAQSNDTITPSEPNWEQRSTSLQILIGDADVDKFMQQTRTDQNIKAAIIEKKAKAMAYEFNKQAILGRVGTEADTNSIKGLIKIVGECDGTDGQSAVDFEYGENTQVWDCANAGGTYTSVTLTLDMIDQLLDLVKPKADAIIMNRRMRRKLVSLARATGFSNMQIADGKLGNMIEYWGDTRIIINDWIPDNMQDGDGAAGGTWTFASYNPATTRADTLNNSMIFAVRFGEDGLCGLQNGGIQIEDIGTVDNKDADRTRIKWYCGMEGFSKYSVAALYNVCDGTTT